MSAALENAVAPQLARIALDPARIEQDLARLVEGRGGCGTHGGLL
jgi:hypothetical protein